MAEFPYTQSPGNIKKLFDSIQSVGKPDKVTTIWLESIGLKSSNDRKLVNVLKYIGFTDNSGTPTQIWMDYRDRTRSAVVLAQAIRAGYSSLFAMYPDAHRKDDEALRNFFNSRTSVAGNIVNSMLSTFKALLALADFNASVPEEIAEDVADVSAEKEQEKMQGKVKIDSGSSLAVTVNIQLQVPATDDASVYDNFFASLYKHILSKDKE